MKDAVVRWLRSEPRNIPSDPLLRTWQDPVGLKGFLTTVQNGPLVNRYLVAAFGLFLLGGIEAVLMRTQLAVPEGRVLGAQHFNQLFSMHGSIMMFLVAVPIIEALASFALPVLLGARELPFPRMTAFGLWTYVFGAALLYSSRLFHQLPEAGWTAYPPLAGREFSADLGIDFWLLGLSVAEVAAIGAGIELIIATLKMRAPGMTLSRMPVYAWSVLITAYMMLFGFTPLLVATTLLELDRKAGMRFFDPAAGGDPLLWQHLFWIFGHPDVYIQLLPATGMIALVLAAFTRRGLVGHTFVVGAMVAIGIVSFGLWAHHMFSAGLSVLGMSLFSAASMAIAIPSGIQVTAWILTLWKGRPVFTTALMFALGFVVTFVMGGVTGVMVASLPFDWQAHDTQFVVGHLHYVLVGGVVFPIFAGFYYWMPKMVGRCLSERLGRWNFWLMFVGFQVAFFPMHIAGLLGMPRRVFTYPPGLGWEVPNLISTAGAYILGLGVLLFVVNVIWNAVLRRGAQPDDNPWRAGTLDWATPTPPPDEGYRAIPLVHSRYPLWEQQRLDRSDSRAESIVRGLAEMPTEWRAQLVTSAVTAEPQAIVRLAGPSIWPLLASVALTLNFIATLIDNYWMLIVSVIGTATATIGWLWPSKEERERRLAGEDSTIHGLPVYTSGTSAPAWWTMMHVLLVIAVVTACLVMSYFYLRAGESIWPPAGARPPSMVLGGLAALAVGGAALAAWWAERAIRVGAQAAARLGLGGVLVLGAASLALLALDLLSPSVPHFAHAYGSAVSLLVGYQAALVVGALVLSGVVLVQAWLGYFDTRRFMAIQNTALFATAIAVNGLVIFGVAYLSPLLR